MVLVVKGPKEALLAAKLNMGFRIYVVPVDLRDGPSVGLISAFFDDEDEPLVLFTPLFADEFSDEVVAALQEHVCDAHLFDENGRELLGYSARIVVDPVSLERLRSFPRYPFSYALARDSLDQLQKRFGVRTSGDDVEAIRVEFVEPIFPEDVFITDLRPESHLYNGTSGYTSTMLERTEPGRFQEEDAIGMLLRIFQPAQIYHAPLRTYDREEIADVLVVSDDWLLIVQAKDSPNTEQALRVSLDRKRKKSVKSLAAAAKQIKGAVGYVRRDRVLKMIVNGEEVALDTSSRSLMTLIVLKEMFNDTYREYSQQLLSLAEELQVACIALDMNELNMYTTHLRNEEEFYVAYERVFYTALGKGQFPRLRLGVMDRREA